MVEYPVISGLFVAPSRKMTPQIFLTVLVLISFWQRNAFSDVTVHAFATGATRSTLVPLNRLAVSFPFIKESRSNKFRNDSLEKTALSGVVEKQDEEQWSPPSVVGGAMYSSSSSPDQSHTGNHVKGKNKGYDVREVTRRDLSNVSKILVDSFYDATSMFRHYHTLKELDRLQTNFPYDNEKHAMFVGCTNEYTDSPDSHDNDGNTRKRRRRNHRKPRVIGFVDVDGRTSEDLRKPLPANAPPRPYLSDLAVHHLYRRRGIAKALIAACERKALSMKYTKLYLRVKYDNEAALSMYASLGYTIEPHHFFGVKDDTLLLKRVLVEESDEKQEEMDSSVATGRKKGVLGSRNRRKEQKNGTVDAAPTAVATENCTIAV